MEILRDQRVAVDEDWLMLMMLTIVSLIRIINDNENLCIYKNISSARLVFLFYLGQLNVTL